MEKVINVAVANKIAKNLREKEAEYVCGNSDYVVEFDFDAEWDAFDAKTARFKYNGTHQDIVFTGNRVSIPKISNTYMIEVGVFAGDLHTTTPAIIMAKKSILCGGGIPADPEPDVYAQLMEKISELTGVDPEMVAEVVEAYMAKHPESDPTVPAWAKKPTKPTYTAEEVGALPADTEITPLYITLSTNNSIDKTTAEIAEAYEAGRPIYFILPQSDGYDLVLPLSVAVSNGLAWVFNLTGIMPKATNAEAGYVMVLYDGTVSMNMKTLANTTDIPTALPNPNALTITGAVNATYDGSEAASVEIPVSYTKDEIDAIMGSYVTDIDTLVGGDG